MNTYGLITGRDAQTLTETLDMVCHTFPQGVIMTTELGVRDGRTSMGIHDYLTSKERINFHVGIDNNHDLQTQPPFPGCHLIIGNSMEVYNQLSDGSQHLIFIDANHSYPLTLVDFLVYSDKVKRFGYIAFHDCGPQIPEMKDWQGLGSKLDKDMYISCRKAVKKLGLLDNKYPGWTLEKDISDPAFDTGGIIVVQKMI